MSFKKIFCSILIIAALLATGVSVSAYPRLQSESHGSIGLYGAFERYWNNYSNHAAYVSGNHGQYMTVYKPANSEAYAHVSTYWSAPAHFAHSD
jgi:hypothetical protein